MISPTNLSSAHVQQLTTVTPVWTTTPRSDASWIDGHELTAIAGQVSPGARSLSVEEHTERVLTYLIGQRDAPA